MRQSPTASGSICHRHASGGGLRLRDGGGSVRGCRPVDVTPVATATPALGTYAVKTEGNGTRALSFNDGDSIQPAGAIRPRTGDGPLEAVKEGQNIVMRRCPRRRTQHTSGSRDTSGNRATVTTTNPVPANAGAGNSVVRERDHPLTGETELPRAGAGDGPDRWAEGRDRVEAPSAGSIPVIRSSTKAQVSDLGLRHCLDLTGLAAPSACPNSAECPGQKVFRARVTA
ncbi:DUF3117 domain-containing protein [Streptomyces sp. NPDC020817]|uniref:DUF3117 domain-containing protein n=1 Tax=Streptomyces sp. NPDC020817 TaxID=3365095 RepID=UPI00379E0BF0